MSNDPHIVFYRSVFCLRDQCASSGHIDLSVQLLISSKLFNQILIQLPFTDQTLDNLPQGNARFGVVAIVLMVLTENPSVFVNL